MPKTAEFFKFFKRKPNNFSAKFCAKYLEWVELKGYLEDTFKSTIQKLSWLSSLTNCDHNRSSKNNLKKIHGIFWSYICKKRLKVTRYCLNGSNKTKCLIHMRRCYKRHNEKGLWMLRIFPDLHNLSSCSRLWNIQCANFFLTWWSEKHLN